MSAAITSYTTLQSTILDYLQRSDLNSEGLIQNFEERFYRDPKNWGPWMESAYSAAMSSGVSAVPSGFLAWKNVYISTSPTRRLKPTGLSQLYDEYPRNGCSGIPSLVARNGANFEYGPYPSSNYTVGGTYYQKPTALRSFASDAAAHYLILNAPDLILYGALIEAMAFLGNDERLPVWQAFKDKALLDYQKLQAATNMSGGPMAVRAM
jgi:hypothetical protein